MIILLYHLDATKKGNKDAKPTKWRHHSPNRAPLSLISLFQLWKEKKGILFFSNEKEAQKMITIDHEAGPPLPFFRTSKKREEKRWEGEDDNLSGWRGEVIKPPAFRQDRVKLWEERKRKWYHDLGDYSEMILAETELTTRGAGWWSSLCGDKKTWVVLEEKREKRKEKKEEEKNVGFLERNAKVSRKRKKTNETQKTKDERRWSEDWRSMTIEGENR